MPVYNAEKYLKRTIQHILDQKYSNWELFAVDNGSTDLSLNILNSFTDPRIRVYKEEKKGPAYARNKAIEEIKKNNSRLTDSTATAEDLRKYFFECVAYCDSDDRWNNNHLLNSLNNIGEHDMIYSDCDFILENENPVITTGVPYYDVFDRTNLLKQNFIYISTVVHKIHCLVVGNFDEQFVPQEDYDMWLRISKLFSVTHLKEKNVTYLYKLDGSYYTAEESSAAKRRISAKNNIQNTDVHVRENILTELDNLKKSKIDYVKKQKYEEVAILRDKEKKLEKKLDKFDNEYLDFSHIPGWLSKEEGIALNRYSKDKNCLEIGSYKGRSSSYIASSANTLVCIDSFKADGSGQEQQIAYTTLNEFLENTKKFNNIAPFIGESYKVHHQFKEEQFDLIFIDGMHDYESVMRDINDYWPKLKNGGIMCLHDYQKDWPGVIKAVDKKFGKPNSVHDTVAVVFKGEKTEENKDLLEEKFILSKKIGISIDELNKMSAETISQTVEIVKNIENKTTFEHSSDKRIIKKVILIAPFSSKLPDGKENAKNYPYFKELINSLKENGCYIKQIGVSGDPMLGADEIILNASNEKIKELLDESDTFISVDSFLPHLAHYVNKHGIVIFSQSDPEIFGYKENLNLLKSRDYLRKEQFWLWSQTDLNMNSFMPVDEVLDKVLAFLELQK